MIRTVLLTEESKQLTVLQSLPGAVGGGDGGAMAQARSALSPQVPGGGRLFPLQDLHLIHLPLASLEPFLSHYLSSDISDIVVCHQPVCILMRLYSLPTLVFRDT